MGDIETESTPVRSGGLIAAADHGEPTPEFGYQLVDAYLYDCSVVRRPFGPEDPDRPRFDVELDNDDEPDGFSAQLSVRVVFRHLPEAVCEIRAQATGIFHEHGAVPDEDARVFRGADCAVLLWPYLRGYVGELGRMLDIELPPLPTIDVRSALSAWRTEQRTTT